MEFHPGRILGIIMGVVILGAIAFLPFGSPSPDTLLKTFGTLSSNLSAYQAGVDTQTIIAAYLIVVATIILIIAGVVGVFPLGTGVMGVIGMAMITVAPFIAVHETFITGYGVGFVVIWAASIVSLGASFWHRGRRTDIGLQQNVVVQQPPAQPPPSPPASPPTQ
jgi:hypothetical protein